MLLNSLVIYKILTKKIKYLSFQFSFSLFPNKIISIERRININNLNQNPFNLQMNLLVIQVY